MCARRQFYFIHQNSAHDQRAAQKQVNGQRIIAQKHRQAAGKHRFGGINDSRPGGFDIFLSIALSLLFRLSLPLRGIILAFEALACYILLFIRQFQILSYQCGSFRAFLYLCGLEIIPVVGLVFTFIFL